ncbi:MAG: hypothetical protein BYD32DRAFT_441700 [Podila humilis]|nr:MAG: hypothetical protein BYD32DRAFT_441700 [Podila humilis]
MLVILDEPNLFHYLSTEIGTIQYFDEAEMLVTSERKWCWSPTFFGEKSVELVNGPESGAPLDAEDGEVIHTDICSKWSILAANPCNCRKRHNSIGVFNSFQGACLIQVGGNCFLSCDNKYLLGGILGSTESEIGGHCSPIHWSGQQLLLYSPNHNGYGAYPFARLRAVIHQLAQAQGQEGHVLVTWVQGHANNAGNILADGVAGAAAHSNPTPWRVNL